MNAYINGLIKVAIVGFVACTFADVSAYEVATHAELTSSAFNRSILAQQDFVETLGISAGAKFDESRADSGRPIVNDGTVEGWLRQGAVKEDGFGCTDTRPTNHFFDPANDRPLTYLFRTWGLRSPDWALEDRQNAEGQDYSLKDALERFHEAMSLPEKDGRDRSFGLLFQTLGHVMHHVQDMAQPEHVRNDRHRVTQGAHV
jgi:hypothetical protein